MLDELRTLIVPNKSLNAPHRHRPVCIWAMDFHWKWLDSNTALGVHSLCLHSLQQSSIVIAVSEDLIHRNSSTDQHLKAAMP